MVAERVFFALGDSTRLEILARLAETGPQITNDLLRDLGITRQGAARHLTILESAGLVTAERKGREVVRSLNREALGVTSGWLKELEEVWDARLARLKKSYES